MQRVRRQLLRAVTMLLPLALVVVGFPSPASAAASQLVTVTGPGTVAESAGTASFTIAYTGGGTTFSVDYATADGTAVAPGDYTATSGTANFTPSSKSATVTVPIVDDALNEATETFDLTISLAAGTPGTVAISGSQTATTSITDNDPTPSVSVTNAPSVAEGNSGTTTLTFTVGLSAASGRTVTVDWATADGTATAGSDYVAGSGTLTFTPGQTSKPVGVTVNGDTLDEPDETVALNLSNPAFATVGSSGTGTILDDDPSPNLSIADAGTVTEGNSGTTTATFAVTLDAASGRTVTVNWATADGTATTADADYVAGNGTLTFNPGQTSKNVTVTVNGDTTYEANETFTVGLSGPSGATIVDGSGTGTITNDDTAPSISIADATPVAEGNAGTKTATFTVTLTGATALSATVDWATADGTATTADGDYIAGNGTLTFTPGQTSKTVTVTVNGDTTYEANETFTVGLSNPSGATIGTATGTGTITNDDAVPSVSIADATPVVEGNAGTTTATFPVTLAGTTELPVTVDWATADGSATTAGSDYLAGNGTLTFSTGQTSKNVTVTVNGDTTYENDETFTVGLSNANGATIGTATGTGTITNDDALPKVSIANAAPVAEGDTGTTTTTLTVSLSGASALPVTVDWATADGTATTADADYVAGNGTLTFNPGQTSKNVTVTVNGDTTYERKESLSVVLSNVSAASLGTSTATAAITNDDPAPIAAIGDASVVEGNAGTTSLTFTVTLAGTTALPAVVRYATSDGTATAGSDYTAATGTLTFGVGETSKTVTVAVNGDTAFEPDETLSVNLTALSDVQLGDGHAVGTITNDDPRPTSLTVKLVKKPAKIKARGTLSGGAVDGMPVTVTLAHLSGGKWVTVTKRTVSTTNASGGSGTYIAAFPRPAKGTYRFTARFKGDATHLTSVKSLRFTL